MLVCNMCDLNGIRLGSCCDAAYLGMSGFNFLVGVNLALDRNCTSREGGRILLDRQRRGGQGDLAMEMNLGRVQPLELN